MILSNCILYELTYGNQISLVTKNTLCTMCSPHCNKKEIHFEFVSKFDLIEKKWFFSTVSYMSWHMGIKFHLLQKILYVPCVRHNVIKRKYILNLFRNLIYLRKNDTFLLYLIWAAIWRWNFNFYKKYFLYHVFDTM
jgi:hypothetical protein